MEKEKKRKEFTMATKRLKNYKAVNALPTFIHRNNRP